MFVLLAESLSTALKYHHGIRDDSSQPPCHLQDYHCCLTRSTLVSVDITWHKAVVRHPAVFWLLVRGFPFLLSQLVAQRTHALCFVPFAAFRIHPPKPAHVLTLTGSPDSQNKYTKFHITRLFCRLSFNNNICGIFNVVTQFYLTTVTGLTY